MAQFALTAQQIEDLRRLLVREERQLQATLDRQLHTEGHDRTTVAGRSDADWSTANAEADGLLGRAERDARELSNVAAALAKLDDDSYGVCEDCGEAIGYTRLLAYPAARRCLPCQQKFEARHGH